MIVVDSERRSIPVKYNANRAYALIPQDVLGKIELVNVSYRCACNQLHYMPSLGTTKRCSCGAEIRFNKAQQIHYMKNDPWVRRDVRAILKKLGLS